MEQSPDMDIRTKQANRRQRLELFLSRIRKERKDAAEAKKTDDPRFPSMFDAIARKMVGADEMASRLGEPQFQARVAASYGSTLYYMERYSAAVRYFLYSLSLLDCTPDNAVKESLVFRINEGLAAAYRVKRMYMEEQEVWTYLRSIARTPDTIADYEAKLRESEDEEQTMRNQEDSTPLSLPEDTSTVTELPSYVAYSSSQSLEATAAFLEPQAMATTFQTLSASFCEHVSDVCEGEEALGGIGASKLSLETLQRQFEHLSDQFLRLRKALTKPHKRQADNWEHCRAAALCDWRSIWKSLLATRNLADVALPRQLRCNPVLSHFAAIYTTGWSTLKPHHLPSDQAGQGKGAGDTGGASPWQVILSESGDVMLGRRAKPLPVAQGKAAVVRREDAFSLEDEQYFGEVMHEEREGQPPMEWRHVTWFGRWRAIGGPLARVRKVACGVQHVLTLMASGEMWAWGRNDFGQCGLGPDANVFLAQQKRASKRKPLLHTPVNMPFPIPVTQFAIASCPMQDIACGAYHSAGVSVDGTSYVWGRTTAPHGEAGTSLHRPRLVIPRFQEGRKHTAAGVSCEANATYFVASDGAVVKVNDSLVPLKSFAPSLCFPKFGVGCTPVRWKEVANRRFIASVRCDWNSEEVKEAEEDLHPDYKCLGIWSGVAHTIMLVEARKRPRRSDADSGSKEEEETPSNRSSRSRVSSTIAGTSELTSTVTRTRFLIGWGRNCESQLGSRAARVSKAGPVLVLEHEGLISACTGDYSTAALLMGSTVAVYGSSVGHRRASLSESAESNGSRKIKAIDRLSNPPALVLQLSPSAANAMSMLPSQTKGTLRIPVAVDREDFHHFTHISTLNQTLMLAQSTATRLHTFSPSTSYSWNLQASTSGSHGGKPGIRSSNSERSVVSQGSDAVTPSRPVIRHAHSLGAEVPKAPTRTPTPTKPSSKAPASSPGSKFSPTGPSWQVGYKDVLGDHFEEAFSHLQLFIAQAVSEFFELPVVEARGDGSEAEAAEVTEPLTPMEETLQEFLKSFRTTNVRSWMGLATWNSFLSDDKRVAFQTEASDTILSTLREFWNDYLLPSSLRFRFYLLLASKSPQIPFERYKTFLKLTKDCAEEQEIGFDFVDVGIAYDEDADDSQETKETETGTRSRRLSFAVEREHFHAIIAQLEKDINRTFSRLRLFHDGGVLNSWLREIMYAYAGWELSRQKPGGQTGSYSQCMPYFAAALSVVCPTKYDAFCCFTSMLSQPPFSRLQYMDGMTLHDACQVYGELLKHNIPGIATIVEESAGDHSMYLYGWVQVLGLKSLLLHTAMVVIDGILLHGTSFLFRSLVALLVCLAPAFAPASAAPKYARLFPELGFQESDPRDDSFELLALLTCSFGDPSKGKYFKALWEAISPELLRAVALEIQLTPSVDLAVQDFDKGAPVRFRAIPEGTPASTPASTPSPSPKTKARRRQRATSKDSLDKLRQKFTLNIIQ